MLQSIDTLIAFVLIMTVASLFVTIIVQMFSSALSLRGKNLANALALTFQTIAPSLKENAHLLAAKILTDPLFSDSTMTKKDRLKNARAFIARERAWTFGDLIGASHLASAIRPEEVYAALQRLSEMPRSEPRTHPAKGAAEPKLSDEMKTLRESADEILKALASSGKKMAAIGRGADAALENFEAWFATAQDRAQQWFQVHTRALTIAASILIALLLQLDAVEIFHFVSTDAAARNALVASADQVVKQADGALDEKGGLLKRIADAATKPGQPPLDLSGIVHTGQLQAALEKRDGANFNEREFDRTVSATTAEYYKDQRDKLGELTRSVSATGFEFIPIGYWRWPAGNDAARSARNIVPHLPGILLFAALLTLGAPYWFNVLKNLSSLRPALARAIGNEEDARESANDKPDRPKLA